MSLLHAVRQRTPLPLKRVVHAARRQRHLFEIRRRYSGDGGPVANALAVARLAVRPARTILFYPWRPDRTQIIYKVCLLNNYRITTNPRAAHDVVHKHIDGTVTGSYAPVERAGPRTINARSTDIRKERVQEVFAEVFGYDLGVDPRTFRGRAVRKSDENAKHDGEVVECPYTPDPAETGIVYQKLVDTEDESGSFIDLRVPIYDGEIPLVYRKYRPSWTRFVSYYRSEVVETRDVLSEEEARKITALTARLHLDFGELDVLRDRDDGRIYVVDVNNTPYGPPRHLPQDQAAAAVHRLAAAYRQMVESRLAGVPTRPAS